MAALESTMEEAAAAQRERDRGQTSIFGDAADGESVPEASGSLPNVPEWDQGQMLKYERDLTGFYITAHPLARFEPAIRRFATTTIEQLAETGDGKEVSEHSAQQPTRYVWNATAAA
jgi:DNA polymerase-3 subunit alpha